MRVDSKAILAGHEHQEEEICTGMDIINSSPSGLLERSVGVFVRAFFLLASAALNRLANEQSPVVCWHKNATLSNQDPLRDPMCVCVLTLTPCAYHVGGWVRRSFLIGCLRKASAWDLFQWLSANAQFRRACCLSTDRLTDLPSFAPPGCVPLFCVVPRADVRTVQGDAGGGVRSHGRGLRRELFRVQGER